MCRQDSSSLCVRLCRRHCPYTQAAQTREQQRQRLRRKTDCTSPRQPPINGKLHRYRRRRLRGPYLCADKLHKPTTTQAPKEPTSVTRPKKAPTYRRSLSQHLDAFHIPLDTLLPHSHNCCQLISKLSRPDPNRRVIPILPGQASRAVLKLIRTDDRKVEVQSQALQICSPY